MAEYCSAIVGFVAALPQIKKYVVTPIKNQFIYLFCYEKLIQSLRVQVGSLEDERASLQRRVDAERRNLQDIDRGVLKWLERVEKIKQDSENLVGAVPEDQNGTCLNGKCPKPKLRYCQSLQATKLTAAVVQLQEECSKFGTIAYPPPMEIEAIPPPSGTQEFESRKLIEEEIMACLKNDTIFMIGVCGMGGVGKTTMAKKIWRRASEIFDEIVMTEGLGQDADQLKIQQQIAGRLGLELTEDRRTNRGRLLQRLKGKKVLLVLDDVWEKLDLEQLGISSQNMNKGCKIILTTRYDRVCIESTNDAKIIKLGVLCEEEAFALFQEKAGNVVANLRQLATDVATECKGLPLALVTVGSALKQRTNIAVWEDALLQLRHAAPTNIPDFLKEVYQPLQLSYNALESNVEARYLFLICCLFPEDSEISLNDLVHYGIGLGIFSNIGNLREASNRVCVLVEILKSRFLLMDATNDGDYPMVKMHDVVRDMAIWISSKGTEHVFKVSHIIGLSEWPIKDSCENYTCISLILGDAMVVPKECMNCPKLEALLVRWKYSDEAPKLPDTFFNRMRGLRLLSISNCIVPSSSLSLLTQLRVLRLHYCGLKMISFIGEFVNLEILSLVGADIEALPDEIGTITKLKVLDLNGCDNLKKITPGVISRLVQLEELRLFKCPIEWEGEEKGNERSNASLVEVFSLKNLRTLEIWIKDPQVIPQDRGGQLQELTSYNVIIGKSDSYHYGYQKCMSINVDEMRNCFVNSMCVLFMGAEGLDFKGKGSKEIIEVLERQGFENVKELKISNLGTAKHLATVLIQRGIAPIRGSAIFPVLRRLNLSEMDDLEEICDGPPTLGSFSKLEEIWFFKLPGLMYLWKYSNEKLCLPNLKTIDIFGCEKLKWVFPLSIAESLCQLETIDIQSCPNMEEVFLKDEISQGSSEGGDDSDHMNIKFPKLNTMILEGVPKLSALCKAVDVFEIPSITKLKISKVSWGNLKMLDSRRPDLFNKEGAIFPVLRRLNLSEMDDLEEICDGPPTLGSFSKLEEIWFFKLPGLMYLWKYSNEKLCLPNLKKIEIWYCEKLKWVFPLSIAESLCQLETIEIKECPNMEEVFIKDEIRGSSEEGGDDSDHMNIKFPKLNTMILEGVPKLSALCKAVDVFEIPSITILEISKVSWGNLKMLDSRQPDLFNKEVSYIDSKGLRMSQIDVFTGLHELKISDCFELRTLFSSDSFKSLINLKELSVSNCLILEEIVEKQNDEEKVLNLPQLESLELSKLPKIRYFCNFKNILELPSLKEIIIRNCPLMETFAVESCSTRMPNSIPKFFFSKEVICPNLCKLMLNGIKTASVIFSQEFQISGLKVLKVKGCHDFKSVVGKENDDSIPRCFISKEVTFHNLCELVLHGITTASVIFSHEFPISELQILKVRHCHFKSLVGKEDDDSISRCFITKEVPCSKLKKLVLDGLKFASLIFSHEIPIGSLSALETLEVRSCHNLKSLFSPCLFREITNLKDLVVRDCSMLEVVFAKEEVDDGSWEKKNIKELKFEKIVLSELPKLRSFYVGLEFFPLPKWVQIHGIKDPEFASRVFFNREHCQDEDNLSKGCFMLFPSDLSFTCHDLWELFLVKGLSDVFFLDGWKKVCGRFGIEKLSPNITYEISFVIMLTEKSRDQKLKIVVAKDEREEDMSDKPMEEWIEIVAGEFSASSTQSGEIEFSITKNYFWPEGVIFKCVYIRPKEPIT